MAKSKSKPIRKSKRLVKNRAILAVLSCLVIAVVLVVLFFPPANKAVKKTRFYRALKDAEGSLIEDDEKLYGNAKGKNRLKNFDVENKRGESEKRTGIQVNPNNVDYGKKDRDYLDNLIKKSN